MGLSSKQLASIRDATAPANIWHGAIRSGKTLASLIAWANWIRTDAPAGPLAMVGRTTDSLRRNTLEPLRQLHPAMCSYSRHAPVASVMGRPVHLFGVNDAKAEEKLRGITLAGAYVDEITTIQEPFFVQLLGRLSVLGARLFGTTNPDNPQHWFKTRYLDQADALGWNIWHFVMADNPGLSADYIDAKRREFSGSWYRRFILGEWTTAEGAIYDMWDETRHMIAWQDLPLMRSLPGLGVDYGTTNPSAGILLGIGRDGILYAVDEWSNITPDGQRRATDAEQAASLIAWLNGQHVPQRTEMRPRHIIIDPSAASFTTQLMRDGVRNLYAADNAVTDGIRTVAALLATDRLRISNRCIELAREIPGYVWDDKAASKGDDKPVKKNDHFVDALRYAVHTTEPLWRPHLRKEDPDAPRTE